MNKQPPQDFFVQELSAGDIAANIFANRPGLTHLWCQDSACLHQATQ